MGSCISRIYYNLGITSPYNELDYIDCEKGYLVTVESDNESAGSIIVHDGDFDSFLYGSNKKD